jgi:hypothetical protein
MIGEGDVAVNLSLTLGKITKLWLITKVCLNAFTRHIAYIMSEPVNTLYSIIL